MLKLLSHEKIWKLQFVNNAYHLDLSIISFTTAPVPRHEAYAPKGSLLVQPCNSITFHIPLHAPNCAISTTMQQHYMSLITSARGAAVPFWSLLSFWRLEACAFLYNLHYRGLISIAFAGLAAVPFWFLPYSTSRFSSWYCVNTCIPVFLHSGLTFKLFGWLYDPAGWFTRAHLHPRNF